MITAIVLIDCESVSIPEVAEALANLDGVSDIVWYNPTTNGIDIWLIKNAQWAGSVDIGTHPAGWVPVGLGDFDHNGVPDIAWQETATNRIDNWMLTFA